MRSLLFVLALITSATVSSHAQEAFPEDFADSILVIPFETRTLPDHAFLKGDKTAGASTEIAGVLRLPNGSARRSPAVVLVAGSGGIVSNNDAWDRQFLSHGIATFTIDGFTGRGISSLIEDQSKLGLLNMIVDLYRALGVLAKEQDIDATQIAVMGFSRGGTVALYSAMDRFQSAWNESGVVPAAYIPLYPFCNIEFRGEENVVGGPIRIFHGAIDDYVQIAPCQAYVDRLKKAGKDAEITALPNAYHGFDVPSAPSPPELLPDAERSECKIVENDAGAFDNAATGKPWAVTAFSDPCNKFGAHIGYSAEAAATTHTAVIEFLTALFKLK
jgi:dienelactone hydrolase